MVAPPPKADSKGTRRPKSRPAAAPKSRPAAASGSTPRRGSKAAAPPRTRLILDERRAKLIALGLDLFSSRAYDEVHIAELARVAGISKGLLYHYFPTKRDFYIAALRVAADRLLQQTQLDPSLPPLLRLRTGLHRYLGYVEHFGTSFLALMRGGVGADPTFAVIIEDTRLEYMGRLITGLALTPDALPPILRTALRGWIGSVEAASLDWVQHHDIPADILVDFLVGQLLLTLQSVGIRPVDAA